MPPHRIASEPQSYGPASRPGDSFEARAEARQRSYRADILGVGYTEYGHWLDGVAAKRGANFVVDECTAAAVARRSAGKGVADRTFINMLASQAMAFNVFGPLIADPELACRVLAPLVPKLRSVQRIIPEYTPPHDVFRDQSGTVGVDCDLLIEATLDDGPLVITVETKFVETKFSNCGHRTSKKRKAGRACPEGVQVASARSSCAYQALNRFAYWERTDEYRTLLPLSATGCPFGGPLWQLWVNHTLAHVEAARRGSGHARFLVCAPAGNDPLLRGGRVLSSFRALLAKPETFGFLPLDNVIARIAQIGGGPAGWVEGITARYAGI